MIHGHILTDCLWVQGSEDGSEGEGFTEAADFFKQELGKIETSAVLEREREEQLRAEMREEARVVSLSHKQFAVACVCVSFLTDCLCDCRRSSR